MNMTADRKGNISEDHSLQDRLLGSTGMQPEECL